MITRDNLNDVIKLITPKDIKRIVNTDKEYTVIYLHITNALSWVTITLTNDLYRYQNVGNSGNCILETSEVIGLINENSDKLSVMQEYQRIGGLI